MSCDILPTDVPGPHIQGDIRDVDLTQYDLMIAHPPCTHLAVSGAAWFKYKEKEQKEALEFVQWLMDAPVPKIAIENPVSVISTRIRKPEQIIHPWQFGHAEEKTTCLWLKDLPKLEYTNVIPGKHVNKLHRLGPSKDRWKLRSVTFSGIANAMADQWSK